MEKVSGKGFGTRRQVHGRWKNTYCSSTWFRKNDIGDRTDPQDERKSTDFSSIHYDPGAVDRKDRGSFFM